MLHESVSVVIMVTHTGARLLAELLEEVVLVWLDAATAIGICAAFGIIAHALVHGTVHHPNSNTTHRPGRRRSSQHTVCAIQCQARTMCKANENVLLVSLHHIFCLLL